MTPEAQRIAIAKACGWRAEKWASGGWTCYNPSGSYGEFTGSEEAAFLLNCPDYLNDLNAMHEAEKVLTHADQCQYGRYLTRLVTGIFQMHHAHSDTARIAHAIAAQRAEAFLLTIGKWVPST